MAHIYSENLSCWANYDAKQASTRGGSKALTHRALLDEKDTEAALGRIEPVRLTFDSPTVAQKTLTDQRSASYQDGDAPQAVDREATAETIPADHTPAASVLDGVQTPDPPEELTGQPGVHLQASGPALMLANCLSSFS